MSKPSITSPLRGFINIDKPAGMTSFDVVRAIRRASGVRRVGHAGTLDPLATGVLPVAMGDATRLVDALTDTHKRYVAEVTLGSETTTDDIDGDTVTTADEAAILALSNEQIASALATFEGEQSQVPPAFSAIKRAGVPAYRSARRGETVTLAPRAVVAYSLRLADHVGARCTVEVECGSGYYVRALARDLGRALGVGAHVSALRRTQVGPFEVNRAVPLSTAVEAFADGDDLDMLIHAPDAVLADWPAILLDANKLKDIRMGRIVAPEPRMTPRQGTRARAYGPDGWLAAITDYAGPLGWQPIRVFHTHPEEKP